jgi:hypothetical protein
VERYVGWLLVAARLLVAAVFLLNGLGIIDQTIPARECELPDYVNWRKKSKAARIILRSGLNIVRAISRTLAICAMNPRVVVPYLPAISSSTSTLQEVAAYGQSTLARFSGLILWNSLSGEFISIPKEVIGMETACEDKS